jgi:hypothetical protein
VNPATGKPRCGLRIGLSENDWLRLLEESDAQELYELIVGRYADQAVYAMLAGEWARDIPAPRQEGGREGGREGPGYSGGTWLLTWVPW